MAWLVKKSNLVKTSSRVLSAKKMFQGLFHLATSNKIYSRWISWSTKQFLGQWVVTWSKGMAIQLKQIEKSTQKNNGEKNQGKGPTKYKKQKLPLFSFQAIKLNK